MVQIDKTSTELVIGRFEDVFDYTPMNFPQKGAAVEAQTIAFKNVSFPMTVKKTCLMRSVLR